ncbi:MAG: hypothetical protein P8179_08655 [Candidatus Thiodiazotropha sp.]
MALNSQLHNKFVQLTFWSMFRFGWLRHFTLKLHYNQKATDKGVIRINKLSMLLMLALFSWNPICAGEEKQYDLGNGIVVNLEEAEFNPIEHKIINCEGSIIPCTIDGVFPFGIEFSIPRTYLKSLSLSIHGRTYKLNTSGMYNAWGNRPLAIKDKIKYLGAHCYDEKSCALRGIFSDAAGSFVAEWLIVNGISTRTILTSSNDIVNLFIKNIEPPYYE